MIKFFKKLRQKLLSENKFRKYLLYANGEIVLVVIGILIALQINNWNEKRKDRTTERKLLIALKKDLQSELLNPAWNFHIEKQSMEFIDPLIDFMDNKIIYHDSLDFYFRQTVYVPDINLELKTYRSINNPKGLNIIESDSIRQFLISYADIPLRDLDDIDKVTGIPKYVLPFYLKYFQTYDNGQAESSKPIIPEIMASDSAFRNSLKLLRISRDNTYNWGSERFIVKIQHVINQITSCLVNIGVYDKEQQILKIKSFESLIRENKELIRKYRVEQDSIMQINQ